MERRDFIKKTLCLGCAGALCAGGVCLSEKYRSDNIENNEDMSFENIKNSRYYIDSDNGLPEDARLDIITLCNLKCPKCWRFTMSKKDLRNTPQGYMKFEDFKNFMDRNSFLKKIQISSSGEVFLHPDFDKMIEYACSKGVEIYLSTGTNLNLVKEETLENLVKCGVRFLSVSIDGATPETYKIYRVGGDFNTVINNIKIINNYKEKYKTRYPELEYKFILFGHNEHEIEKAKELAAELNMAIQFSPNYAPEYSPVKDAKRVKELTGINVNYAESILEMFNTGKSYWFPCLEILNSPLVNIKGELLYCCMGSPQYNSRINVFEKGLKNALNDKKIIEMKEMLSDFSKVYKSLPCYSCYIYDFLKNKNHPLNF